MKFLLTVLILITLTFGNASAADVKLRSPAFAAGDPIPEKYTCRGGDISPPLSWTGLPSKTASVALICDDPDAPRGAWTHWVIFNIPPTVSALPAGIPPRKFVLDSALQGINDYRSVGYRGPCPPPGYPHRYRFRLYALDTVLLLPSGATEGQLLEVMEGHILAVAQLTARFRR